MTSDKPTIWATYSHNFFETTQLATAKELILTGNQSMGVEERWKVETPYLTDKILQRLAPLPSMRLLDFGCGIGRLAKVLIEKTGCTVVGVDASVSMRQFAREYVASDKFTVLTPEELDREGEKGSRCDVGIAIWVLQHCESPRSEIQRIKKSIMPGGKFYLVNELGRCAPTNLGWTNDGVDVFSLMREEGFKEIHSEPMTLYPVAVGASGVAQCKTYVL